MIKKQQTYIEETVAIRRTQETPSRTRETAVLLPCGPQQTAVQFVRPIIKSNRPRTIGRPQPPLLEVVAAFLPNRPRRRQISSMEFPSANTPSNQLRARVGVVQALWTSSQHSLVFEIPRSFEPWKLTFGGHRGSQRQVSPRSRARGSYDCGQDHGKEASGGEVVGDSMRRSQAILNVLKSRRHKTSCGTRPSGLARRMATKNKLSRASHQSDPDF